MEEKDRLGQKLRDKEKASEDLYIAEVEERKRLERVRQAAVAAAVREACPRDGAHLKTRALAGITVMSCPTCDGVWLDKGELERMLTLVSEPAVTRWIRSVLGR